MITQNNTRNIVFKYSVKIQKYFVKKIDMLKLFSVKKL